MKTGTALKKGQVIELSLESAAFEGVAVGRYNGLVVFVKNGVPGDRIRVEPEDVAILEETRTDLAVASDGGYLAALDTEIDDGLRAEGYAREIVNRVQRLRREAALEVADRIRLAIAGPEALEGAAATHSGYIAGETLAVEVRIGADGLDGLETRRVKIGEFEVGIGVERTRGDSRDIDDRG